MTPPLGLIEGYYGEPWSWEARTGTMRFLAAHGYGFHMYAPKADPYLRRRWKELHPEDEARALSDFGAECRASGVRFEGRMKSPGQSLVGRGALAP